MEETKKIYSVQVPNILIFTPKHYNELYLYVILKSINGNKPIDRYSHELLELLQWKDIRTLKKYLLNLKNEGYINYNFDDLPQTSKLHIEKTDIKKFKKLNKNGKLSYFTQVNIKLIHKIIDSTIECKIKQYSKKNKKSATKILDLKERSLTLFYYYKSWYNPKMGYSCQAYKQIHKDTGISYEYIKIINKILHKNQLVKVILGDKTKNIDGYNKRERNKYIPVMVNK